MTRQIAYEWKLEVLDHADDEADILEAEHYPTFAEAMRAWDREQPARVCLVRDAHDPEVEELFDRQHAYVWHSWLGFDLPDEFEEGATPVPKYKRAEVDRWIASFV